MTHGGNVRPDSAGTTNHIEENGMSASDELAGIEARLTEDENEYAGRVVDQNVRDRRYLLALVRDQQARLDELMAKLEPQVTASDALDSPPSA
jgi:hypothetical protein